MALDQQQICDLLGTGLSNEVVATAVGCDPSYITQLMSDEDFSSKVIAKRAASLTAHNRRDETIDTLEDKLLVKAHEIIDNGYIYKPNDLVRMMVLVNGMKRRGIPSHESVVLRQTIVNLNLPNKITQKFTVNAHQEVIEVDTADGGKQSLVTMPAHTLLAKLAAEKGTAEGEKYEAIRRFLPPPELPTVEEVAARNPSFRDYSDGRPKNLNPNPLGLSRGGGYSE